jgi:hypothetical protein
VQKNASEILADKRICAFSSPSNYNCDKCDIAYYNCDKCDKILCSLTIIVVKYSAL